MIGRQKEKIPAKKAEDSAEDRRPKSKTDCAGDDKWEIEKRRLPFIEEVTAKGEDDCCKQNTQCRENPAGQLSRLRKYHAFDTAIGTRNGLEIIDL